MARKCVAMETKTLRQLICKPEEESGPVFSRDSSNSCMYFVCLFVQIPKTFDRWLQWFRSSSTLSSLYALV